jgi:hypothetical protein
MRKEYKKPYELITCLETQKNLKKNSVPIAVFDEETYLELFTPFF